MSIIATPMNYDFLSQIKNNLVFTILAIFYFILNSLGSNSFYPSDPIEVSASSISINEYGDLYSL